jgi:hypothetical protein
MFGGIPEINCTIELPNFNSDWVYQKNDGKSIVEMRIPL